MAITVPKDGDIISAGVFGIPVANAVNQLQTRMGGLWTSAAQSIPNGSATPISWNAETEDSNAFAVPPFNTVTIPPNCGGLYAVSVNAYTGSGSAGLVYLAGTAFGTIPPSGFTNPMNAWATVSIVMPIAAGLNIVAYVWQSSGAAVSAGNGRFSIYRIGL